MMTPDFQEKDRKRVLFLGAPGSGKTTLINALVGETVRCLPGGYRTEAITVLRWGQKQSARVLFRNPVTKKAQKGLPGRALNHIASYNVPFHPTLVKNVPPLEIAWEDRREYISPRKCIWRTEPEALPENAFAGVELMVPVSFLKEGIALVDTRAVSEEDPLLEQQISQADLIVLTVNAEKNINSRENNDLRDRLGEKNGRKLCVVLTHMDRIARESDRIRIRKSLVSGWKDYTELGEENLFSLDLSGRSRSGTELDRLRKLLRQMPEPDPGKEPEKSGDNPVELVSLAPHIAFARQVIDKYQWSHQDYRNFILRLNEIQKKQQDRNLNLSIIGEFSSGKSTFINALLRMQLLASDVLQGTTVASTVLEYGPRFGITIQAPDRPQSTQTFSRMQEFQQRLNQIVANNQEAESMGEVLVSLPARSLQSWRCRIIDTPGLNATVQWHEDVTIRTLRERSDLSIILVDAVRPLPEDLCLFIEDHLMSVLDQCIFVVTKIDLIPPRERSRMLKYVQRVVENKFGLEAPLVLPYSSADVVNSFAPGTFPEGRYPSDVRDSFASEKQILEHMARQRAMVQTRNLLSLADMIYSAVEQQLEELTSDYRGRLELLERTRQTDLNAFVAEQNRKCLCAFDEKNIELRMMLTAAIQCYIDQAWDGIRRRIEMQTTPDDLKQYLENQIKNDCEAQAEKICRRIVNRTLRYGDLSGAADQLLKEFREAFQKKFRGLECLNIEHRARIIVPPSIGLPDVRAIAAAEKYAKDMVKREDRWAGGGVAVGAAVGTAIAPGVGTLAGMVIGYFGGKSGGKAAINLKQMQENVMAQLEASLREYFREVSRQATKGVQKYADNIRHQIHKELDGYLKTYRATVNQWIRAEQIQKQQLEDKMQKIREDMQQIDLRRSSLDRIREQIQPSQEETE